MSAIGQDFLMTGLASLECLFEPCAVGSVKVKRLISASTLLFVCATSVCDESALSKSSLSLLGSSDSPRDSVVVYDEHDS